jgi:hypothetical protein
MPIQVCFRNETHPAIVRRCVKDQSGFFIGVAFPATNSANVPERLGG